MLKLFSGSCLQSNWCTTRSSMPTARSQLSGIALPATIGNLHSSEVVSAATAQHYRKQGAVGANGRPAKRPRANQDAGIINSMQMPFTAAKIPAVDMSLRHHHHLANPNTTSHLAEMPMLNHLLPETPAQRRHRRPRADESLMSVNGSPIENPFADEGDISITSSAAPRRITIRDNSIVEIPETERKIMAPVMNIPFDDGATIFELGPSISPSAFKKLLSKNENSSEVVVNLKSFRDHLSSLLAEIEKS
ncbi:hypothetical protein HDU76_011380 [Blyttiomyces sp. JEL0837]|nr:hypothetical protein HDU76_011380 [Blyttiomyces sp. JEL0837]